MFQKFNEFKKQIFYYVEYIQNRIVESNAFNVLREKYQSYPLFHQKVIKYGMVSFIIFLISAVPFYYFYLSSGHWSEFKEKRKLSLDLLKVRKYKSTFSNMTEYRLRREISDIIKKYKEKDFVIKDKKASSKEKKLKKVMYEVKVDHLNIRQAVQMGAELNDLLSVHLFSLIMQESEKYPKHYDVSFKLYAYFYKMVIPRNSFKSQRKDEKPKKSSRLKRGNLKDEKKSSASKFNSDSLKSDKSGGRVKPEKRVKPKGRDKPGGQNQDSSGSKFNSDFLKRVKPKGRDKPEGRDKDSSASKFNSDFLKRAKREGRDKDSSASKFNSDFLKRAKREGRDKPGGQNQDSSASKFNSDFLKRAKREGRDKLEKESRAVIKPIIKDTLEKQEKFPSSEKFKEIKAR